MDGCAFAACFGQAHGVVFVLCVRMNAHVPVIRFVKHAILAAITFARVCLSSLHLILQAQ